MDFSHSPQPNFSFNRLRLCDIALEEQITDTALLIFIEKGTGRVVVSNTEYSVDDHDFLFIFPRTRINWLEEHDCEICVIGYSMMLQESVTMHISPSFFVGLMYQTKWTMADTDLKAARAFCDIFEYNIRHGEDAITADVASTLFSLYIQMFYQKMKGLLPPESKAITILNRSLWWRFIEMVSQHYKEHHHVAFYADQLCVSPKYLTQVVKRIADITPKTLINRRLAGESAYLLARTNSSVQEISVHLGFPDQSYFGRFFKHAFGMSPIAFRLNPDLNVLSRINTYLSEMDEE